MATGSKLPKAAMTLKQFMLRQQVLKLYKEIMVTIKYVPEENDKKMLREWARNDFKNNKHHTDEFAIKILMKGGERTLNELKQNLQLSHTMS